MNSPIHLHKETVLPFLTGAVLFHLSALYFGGVYIRLIRFWYAFFLLDILILIINALTLRYSIDFDRDHLSKGDHIRYSIRIEKGSIFPIPWIRIEQTRIHSCDSMDIPVIHTSLQTGSIWKYDRTVHASVRGVYTMGLSRLSVKGLSGLISIDLPIWARTFYVYPRLLDIRKNLSRHESTGGRNLARTGISGDNHIFQGLREYRSGESIRHISWSRFYQTGLALMKTYSSRGGEDINLFLDRRSSRRSALCDDTVLEIFLCLVYSGLHTGQRLVLHGYPGWENCVIGTEKEFRSLYQTTLLVEFDASDLEELKSLSGQDGVYVVSGLQDLNLLDENSRNSGIDHMIPVTLGMNDEELNRVRSLILTMKSKGFTVSDISSDESLKDELICRLYS